MATMNIASVTQLNQSKVRATFSEKVLAFNPTGSTDALNKANYTFSGPGNTKGAIDSIQPTQLDEFSVDISFNSILAVGNWEIQVKNVADTVGNALVGIQRLVFTVATTPPSKISDGLRESTALDDLLANMASSLQGPNWGALLAAVASGDETNRDTAALAFKQLFAATASGIYLDKRLNEVGISRDPYLGLSDTAFRQIGLAIYQNKLIGHTYWEILKGYYGANAVQAHISSATAYPFVQGGVVLHTGDTLLIEIDKSPEIIKVTFQSTDFTNIANPTATEIATAINKTFLRNGVNAYCLAETNLTNGTTVLTLYSGTLGFLSSVRVVGGTAQYLFRFPTYVAPLNTGSSWSWALNTFTGIVTVTYASGGVGNFGNVRIGDYVGIHIPSLASTHSGTFTVTDVVYDTVGGVYSFQYANRLSATGAHTIADSEVFFGRPDYPGPLQAYVSGADPAKLKIQLPVTTEAIGRNVNTGSYLNSNASVNISTLVRNGAGVVTVVTTTSHGLALNDLVLVDGAKIDSGNLQNFTGWSLMPGVMTTPRRHQVTLKMNTGQIVVIGGFTEYTQATYYSPKTPTATVEKYDFTTKSWSSLAPMISPRAHAAGVVLNDGRILVSGGQLNSASIYSDAEIYNPATNTWTATGNQMHAPRWGHYMQVLYNGKVLSVGGSDYSVYDIYDPNTDLWYSYDLLDQTGAVSNPLNPFTLPTHGLTGGNYFAVSPGVAGCLLSDGKTFICGGGETTASKQTFTYDPVLNQWFAKAFMTTAGPTDAGATFHTCVPWSTTHVIVRGGFKKLDPNPANTIPIYYTGSGDYTKSGHEYNIAGDSWSSYGAPAGLNPTQVIHGGYSSSGLLATGSVLSVGGWEDNIAPPPGYTWSDLLTQGASTFNGFDFALNYARLGRNNLIQVGSRAYIVGGDTLGTIETYPRISISGRVNGLFKVTSVISPTSFTYSTPDLPSDTFAISGTVTPVQAKTGITGPYIFDLSSGISITGVHTEITTAIVKSNHVSSIYVADASGFPETTGWIYINHGKANAQGPIKYLGKVSNTQILVDSSYEFVYDVAVNSKICMLNGKEAWVPDNINQVGGLYLTGTQDARGAAQTDILGITSVSMEHEIQTKYPGDRGLGAEGFPTTGDNKLSSIVKVFEAKGE